MSNFIDPKSVYTMRNAFDFLNWDYYIDEIQRYSEFNKRERKQALEGYKALREILGEKFIEMGYRSGHPFVDHRICNPLPWSLLQNAEFGLKLQCVKRLPNFKKLIKNPFSEKIT